MTTQKEISQTLDTCAARAEYVARTPATGKQCWFLAKLILDNGGDYSEFLLNTSYVLTKKRASDLISGYLN